MTRYIETEALLAVMEEEDDRARVLIAAMSPRERLSFSFQLDRLLHIVQGPSV